MQKETRRYFGKGYKSEWCDVFQATETRKTRTFHGFTLHDGQIFGKDEKSPFILTNIVEESSGKSGVYAEILLWRQDIERGWILKWDRCVATVNAIVMYKKYNWNCKVTRESKESNVNRLQEVKGQKYFQPIC